MNLKPAAVALAAGLTLALTACEPPAHGTVTARIHHGKWRYLAVRQDDGRTVKFRVGLFSSEWRHCHVGEPYPECQ